jgi:hypothetical protein
MEGGGKDDRTLHYGGACGTDVAANVLGGDRAMESSAQRRACCRIMAQADIAQHASNQETAEVVREVSRAAGSGSRAG